MHEFTPSHLTYPFTPHPLFTESGHTRIDYADFLKSKMLHYADNTCLTGRNWVDVNIQKLTIFHFKKLFFSCHSCWVEEEEKRRSSCLGGIVSASIASVDNDVCNIFLSFPHEARSLASFTFCGIVFEENILIFINVRVHAFFFFWHALNIQHHPQVKSINSFRLHESGHREECWGNYCLLVNAWTGDIQNPHVVVLEASFIILFQICSFQILCWHAQHTLTKAADLLSTAGLRGGASWIWLDFHIQHKLDALERWESWRPSQHLELFILFFKLSWRDSAVTGCIHPSASGYYHLRVQLPWRGVRDLWLLVRARVISTWAQGAKFSLENITLPPKDLPSFHCARCCDFFPK